MRTYRSLIGVSAPVSVLCRTPPMKMVYVPGIDRPSAASATSRPFACKHGEDHVVDPFATKEIALDMMGFLAKTQRAKEGQAGHVARIHRTDSAPVGPVAEGQVEYRGHGFAAPVAGKARTRSGRPCWPGSARRNRRVARRWPCRESPAGTSCLRFRKRATPGPR